MFGRIVKWGALGASAGALLGCVDALLIAANARAMFFDSAEMGRTMWMALGMCAGAGAIASSALGIVVETLAHFSEPGKPLNGPYRLELLITALAALPIDLTLLSLTSGPRASQMPFRIVILAVASTVAAAAGAFVITRGIRSARSSKRARYALAALFLLTGAAFVAADLKILVRLYSVFHIALSVLALLAVATSMRFLWISRPGTISLTAAILVLIGSLFAGGLSTHKARSSQNSRFVLKNNTSTASDVLHGARVLLPPPPDLLLDETFFPDDKFSRGKLVGPSPPHLSLPGSPVIMLTVDAMRFDKLGSLSGGVPITPNMNALAGRSVVFEKAYTPLPHTSYAISSLLTGKFTGPLFDVPGAPRVHETWPEILHRFRYKTAAFFTKAVFFIDKARFEPYLRKGYGFGTVKMDYLIPAMERVDQTIEFLDEHKEKGSPVFTWTHFFEPHEPYETECTRFGPEDEQRYDCELYTVDLAIGKMVSYLDESFPEAIIIVTADHGEEFQEHGGRYHGTTLYDEQIKVPLLIKVPKVEPRVVSEPVNLVDILGTVLNILEIPVPARVRSNDLTGLLTGNSNVQRTTFSQVHELVTAVDSRYKLILDREEQIASLFDLEKDPRETRSVAEKHPEITRRLTSEISAWLKSHAYWELRPIKTDDGDAGWPAPIQKALSGDPSATEELLSIAADKNGELTVRRKAAQLFSELSPLAKRVFEIPNLEDGDDPIVRAWLALSLSANIDSKETFDTLAKLVPLLERHSIIWTKMTLACFEIEGDKKRTDDIIEILGRNETPMELRRETAKLLGEARVRKAVGPLTDQINNYQLALDVALALGKIGDKKSYTPLVTRLKRERFPERRAAVAEALVALGDKRAVGPIATELSREEPVPGALKSLTKLNALRPKPLTYADRENNRTVHVSSGGPNLKFRIEPGSISRIFVSTQASDDGGNIQLLCNGTDVGMIPVLSGIQQSYLETDRCVSDDAGFLKLSFQLKPEDLKVEIEAVGVVR